MDRDRYEDVKKDILNLKQEIKNLTNIVETLVQVCSRMDESSAKMGNHIDFVENTYETVRSPLTFITNRINQIRGIEKYNDLPRIEK